MPEVIVSKQDCYDFEDLNAQASVNPNTTLNNILSYTARNNCYSWLAFLGMAWDAGLNNFLTWRLLLNNGKIRQFQDSLVQIAPPEQPWQEITPWFLVPQGGILNFQVDVAGASTAGNVSARFRIYYSKIPSLNLLTGVMT